MAQTKAGMQLQLPYMPSGLQTRPINVPYLDLFCSALCHQGNTTTGIEVKGIEIQAAADQVFLDCLL
jgi:hypothetical protein